jgi:hypothetical protein
MNHADIVGVELFCRVQHVFQQRLAGQRLQHLRQLGAHARALAGGEDDNA